MRYLYHGSSTQNIKVIKKHLSTHGEYVYATPCKELACLFAKRAGDDLTYAVYKLPQKPAVIVERIPFAFEAMFKNSGSIYSVSGENFIDIHTGFRELVSTEDCEVLKEEKIDNIYDLLCELENEGQVQLYTYPNKPDRIPKDNRDLLNSQIYFLQGQQNITKHDFERLFTFHPELMDEINKALKYFNSQEQPFKKEDIIPLYNQRVEWQQYDPENEYYIKSLNEIIRIQFPELHHLCKQPNGQELGQ